MRQKNFENLYEKGQAAKSSSIRRNMQTVRAGKSAENASKPRWMSLLTFTTPKQWPVFFAAFIFAVLTGLLPPALAVILGRLFDDFTEFGGEDLNIQQYQARISKYCIGLSVLSSGSSLLNAFFFILWRAFGDLQGKSCRDRIFDSLLSKSIEWYDLCENGIGVKLSRTQTQIQELQLATSHPLGYVLQYISTTIAALGLALYLSWDLTLVTLATVPISALFVGLIARKMHASIDGQTTHLAMASKHAMNAFNNIETVKCFNGQEQEIRNFSTAIGNAAKYYLRQAWINALEISVVRFMTLCMFVQGFWYGSHLVITGKKSSGTIITTFWACLQATQTIERIFPQMLVLEKGKSASHALGQLTMKTSGCDIELGQVAEPVVPKGCSGDIELRDISFAYPIRPTQMVLRKINMFLAAGETTFIVGHSGCGKTTIAQLLMKFYEPISGTAFLDGFGLSELDTHWLRNHITLVEQQGSLLHASILENIKMARKGLAKLNMSEVNEAIRFSMLSETIENMPDGVDTVVGPRGTSLSGGQRQRVELARARLRDTQILILDESTSALDQVSRSQVLTALRYWRRNKTTIIITHDVSQIADDDFVYVMKDGHVIHEDYAQRLREKIDSPLCQSLPKNLFNRDNSKRHIEISAAPKRRRTIPIGVNSLHHTSTLIHSKQNHNFDLNQTEGLTVPNGTTIHDNRYGKGDLKRNNSLASAHNSTEVRRIRHSRSSFGSTSPSNDRPPECLDAQEQFTRSMPQKETELTDRNSHVATSSFKAIPFSNSKSPTSDCQIRERGKSTNDSASTQESQEELSRRHLKDIFKTVWPSLTPVNKCLLVFAFANAFIDAIATPLFAWIFARLLGTFSSHDNQSQEAMKWSISILVLALVNAVAAFFKHNTLDHCGQAWVDHVRIDSMKRILNQSQEFFSRKENSTSLLIQNLDRDAEEMKNLLCRFAAYVFIAITMCIIAGLWSLIVSWRLALVALATMPIVLALTKGYEIVNSRMETKTNTTTEKAGFIMTEAFTNIKTVRALTLEESFRLKHQDASAKVLRVGLRRALYSGLFFGISGSAMLFVEVILFYFGAYLSWSGLASVQDIIVVFSLLLFTLASVNAILSFIPQIGASRDTAFRLLRLARLPGTSHETLGSTRVASIGDISLKNLTYRYQDRPLENVLRGLTLTFPKGSITAIVGPSGTGKSTIASLLVRLRPTMDSRRFIVPQITIDRRDIARIHTPTLRNLVSVVPQRPVIFPGTVSENITYGLSKTVPENRIQFVEKAAREAGIHEFIMSLPQSYDTIIGNGGADISGGQAQRIAIARALVRQPSVLILDEATSALDAENASWVRESIRKLVRQSLGMTVIIITHHEDMMKIADTVVMLDRGRVVEQGTYSELLGADGPFAKFLRTGDGKRGHQ